MTGLTTLEPTSAPTAQTSAVVWLNGREAIVATTDDGRRIATTSIERGTDPESGYLAHIVHVLGDRERVIILGPGLTRLALEREYVAIFHRPDRLVDVEQAGPLGEDQVVDRLRTLAEF
jgi:hypothetical protein